MEPNPFRFEFNFEAPSTSGRVPNDQDMNVVAKALNAAADSSETHTAESFSPQDSANMSISEASDADTDMDSEESSEIETPQIGTSGSQTPFSAHVTANGQSGTQKGSFLSAINRMTQYVQFASNNQVKHNSEGINVHDVELLKTSPIFTSEVGKHLESALPPSQRSTTFVNQFGLLGLRDSSLRLDNNLIDSEPDENKPSKDDDLVIANMDMPWSAFICGSQGAGKSHTLSCLLENALLDNAGVGQLPNPLAAMVFHYDNYTSASSSQLCEAAYLCTSGIPVTVLVSPSNIWAMSKLYKNLPGLLPNAPKPKVVPLYLAESSLDISTMLKLMAVDPNADSVPLYMETVMSILREMAMEGKGAGAFSYSEFRTRLEAMQWVPGQFVPLSLRLQLLDSFLEPNKFTRSTRPAPATDNIWAFKPGTLTIVDLSDPFVNSNDACSLFSICLSLFMDERGQCGRVVALDEAHKFLLQTGAAKVLTGDLTSVIRQQRHTGTRVLIATQEPTLSPDLLDLSNATFVHRFLSPAWYDVLRKHLAGANKHDSGNNNSLFETIVGLETGEALLFCPTALVSAERSFTGASELKKLGNGYLRVKIRKRITADGGRSIMASETNSDSVDIMQDCIPMHIVTNPPVSTLGPKGKGKAPAWPTSTSTTNVVTRSMTAASPSVSPPAPTIPLVKLPQVPAVNKTSTGQVNPPTAPSGLTDELRLRLEQHARAKLRARVEKEDWKKAPLTKIDLVVRDVEVALGMAVGAIANDNKRRPCVQNAAWNEFSRYMTEKKFG